VVLKTEKVTKTFGDLLALDEVDVSLERGDILGMIGPNGSGKTTLFNVVSGVYRPVAGDIFFQEKPITGRTPHYICRKGIARTFQIAQPFSQMTLLENVLIGAMWGNGKSLSKGRDAAEEVLDLVGLGEKAHLVPDEVTTEDRRRLELARALATKPEILLLDEMMAGLTPTEVEEVLVLLRQIHASGVTIFMVEHIMQAVMSVCNRIIVLNYGKVIAEGTPEDVVKDEEVIRAYLGDRYV